MKYVRRFCFFISAEGQDFDFADGPSVLISAGGSRGCLQISIIPSDVVEPQEEINLAINTTTTAVTTFGAVTTTTVVILTDGSTYYNNFMPVLVHSRTSE